VLPRKAKDSRTDEMDMNMWIVIADIESILLSAETRSTKKIDQEPHTRRWMSVSAQSVVSMRRARRLLALVSVAEVPVLSL